MHDSVQAWFPTALAASEICGARVLEVGSQDVNGSVRPYVVSLGPASYVGVDMGPGKGVDLVMRAESLAFRFGQQAFDIVISTEMLEHARDWRACLRAMLTVLADGGLLLLTTRSHGFPYHGFPEDHWRFALSDFIVILGEARFDQLILTHDPGPSSPGVFVKARRPLGWSMPPDLWTTIQLERAPTWPP
jgi:SAM-dependent methyltransferase